MILNSPLDNFLEFVLTLTWKCNLNCKYCYVKKQDKEVPFNIVVTALNDFRKLKSKFRNLILTLDGGEPTLYYKFYELLTYLNEVKEFSMIRMSTNGTILEKFVDLIPRNMIIQVSIDGREHITDYLRGRGVYQKAIRILGLLKDYKIPHGIGMVFNELTKNEIPHLIQLALRYDCQFLHINYQYNETEFVKKTSIEEYRNTVMKYILSPISLIINISIPLSTKSYCYAGCKSFALLPSLNYVVCPRYPEKVLGKYPEKPSDIVKRLKLYHIVQTPCHGKTWIFRPLTSLFFN